MNYPARQSFQIEIQVAPLSSNRFGFQFWQPVVLYLFSFYFFISGQTTRVPKGVKSGYTKMSGRIWPVYDHLIDSDKDAYKIPRMIDLNNLRYPPVHLETPPSKY